MQEHKINFDGDNGFAEDYTPPKPYQSWGTEFVIAIEDEKDHKPQHIMVMFFNKMMGRPQILLLLNTGDKIGNTKIIQLMSL